MNEAETRAEHIDPALKAAGWGVVEGSKVHREYGITLGRIQGHGKRGKALTADYVSRQMRLAPGARAKGAAANPAPVPPCPGPLPGAPRQKVKVKLADGKARTIQHMMCTTFCHPC